MTTAMIFTRGVLLLVILQSIPVLFFISSAAATRQSEVSSPSLGLRNLLSEGRGATFLPLKERHVNSSRALTARSRRSLLGDAHMPLHDDILSEGYYTTSLFIGTPAREFVLIVDTGSTVTYVPCSSCTHCGTHQDLAFTPEDSSSYEAIACASPTCTNNTNFCDINKQVCKYERRYLESSSTAGVLSKDLFAFGDDTGLGSPKLLFGCEDEETGALFSQKADGIMGLGRGSLSIVDQLVKEKAMADTFSLCYAGMGEQGGNMIMGDFPDPPGMVFTPSDPWRSAHYNIVLKQIKVAGTPLPVPESVFDAGDGTVIDSGTTFAYLPSQAYSEFKRAILHESSLKGLTVTFSKFRDICFLGPDNHPKNQPKKLSEYFPTVDLVFGKGLSLALEPENYLFKLSEESDIYCLGVAESENQHTTLLGGIVVRNMLVKYDRINSRIGFWRTKCTDLEARLQNTYTQMTPPPQETPSPVIGVENPPAKLPVPAAGPTVSEELESITDIGGLEFNLSVVANYTDFNSSAFVEDMARDLQLELHQLTVLGFEEHGSDVVVTCAVSPASFHSPLLGSTVEVIIGRLQQHQVRFGKEFGSYHLNNWRVIRERRSWAEKHSGLFLGLVISTVAVTICGGVAIWFYVLYRSRTHDMKYVVVDPSIVNNIPDTLL